MPPSIGYTENPFQLALNRVLEGLRAQQLPHQPMTGIPQSPIQYSPPSPAFQEVIPRHRPTSTTPWGFHEPTVTAGAGVEAGMQGASDVLADPRNAWIGLGPLAGVARFGRVPHFGKDLGGFNVPSSQMRKTLMIPRPNYRLDEVPGGTEHAVRTDYLGGITGLNEAATLMREDPDPIKRTIGWAALRLLPEEQQVILRNTVRGQQELKSERGRQQFERPGWDTNN